LRLSKNGKRKDGEEEEEEEGRKDNAV